MGLTVKEKVPLSIIMAGGMGVRFGRSDKYLSLIGGIPILYRIFKTAGTFSNKVVVCTKKESRSAINYCEEMKINYITEEEEDYVKAIRYALCRLDIFPAMVISGDIFVFNITHLTDLISFAESSKAWVITLLQRGRPVGISVFKRCPGKNEELTNESFNVNADFCVNVNTLRDYEIALELYSSKSDSI